MVVTIPGRRIFTATSRPSGSTAKWTCATEALATGTSYGITARVNTFGFFIVDMAVSRPMDRPLAGWQWQLGIRQGF